MVGIECWTPYTSCCFLCRIVSWNRRHPERTSFWIRWVLSDRCFLCIRIDQCVLTYYFWSKMSFKKMNAKQNNNNNNNKISRKLINFFFIWNAQKNHNITREKNIISKCINMFKLCKPSRSAAFKAFIHNNKNKYLWLDKVWIIIQRKY